MPERFVDRALESVRASDQHAVDDVIERSCRALPRGYAGQDAPPETLLDALRI